MLVFCHVPLPDPAEARSDRGDSKLTLSSQLAQLAQLGHDSGDSSPDVQTPRVSFCKRPSGPAARSDRASLKYPLSDLCELPDRPGLLHVVSYSPVVLKRAAWNTNSSYPQYWLMTADRSTEQLTFAPRVHLAVYRVMDVPVTRYPTRQSIHPSFMTRLHGSQSGN